MHRCCDLTKEKDQGFKWNTARYDYKNLRFLPLCTSWRNQRKADSSAGKSNLEIISKVKFKYLLIFKNIHQPLPRSALHSFGSGGKQEPWWNGEGDKCVIYPSSSRLIDKIITRLRRRMKTDSGASMPVSAFLRLKHRWALEHVHMFWSTFHYAGSCICLFVMSKYIANFFFMGNLAAVKLLLLFSPQKHSSSLSHSSLASQIVKKKTKQNKTLYEHNMTTRPETKQKSETSYLSYG